MASIRFTFVLATAILCWPLSGSASHAQQDEIPWLDPAARPIVEQVDRFYRSLPAVSCTSEVEVLLGEGTVDDRVAMRAIAVRPNRVSIVAIEPHGYFPTNQFISNGKELFEWSIRRQMFMLSPAAPTLQGLFARAANRSAPNMPIEVFLALMSDQPIKNLLRLDVEPGLVRLAGEAEIEGVRCHELVVNEQGARVWVRAESPNWVMRYRNSPVIALPRYLPPGAKVIGPRIQVDFKSWSMSSPDNEDWDWVIPEGSIHMATMHESAKGGPEDGYRALTLAGNRQNGNITDAAERRGSNLGLRVGPKRGAEEQTSTGPKIGSTAPDVELISLDGTRASLSTIRADRPTALVFWMQDNKFSRTGIPALLTALKPFEKSMAIISIGSGENDAAVTTMIGSNAAFKGSMVDAGGVLARAFSVVNVPAVVLLDRAGRVTNVHIGQNRRLTALVTSECRELISVPVPQTGSKPGTGVQENAPVTESEDAETPVDPGSTPEKTN